MNINAHAKINLGLDVIRRRPDGYHEVRMIMQTLDLHDELSIERCDEEGVSITTNRDDLSVNEDNLIHKAAKLLMDEYDLPGGIRVALTKNIPVAAGLAGGSTDAAATLIALNKLYSLDLDTEDLMKLGVRIGADVPYCIMGGTALSEGIGEVLTPLCACPNWRILLAKPPVSVSTAYVYGNLKLDKVTHPDIDTMIEGIQTGDRKNILQGMGNVLESVTVAKHPVISQIKDIMRRNNAACSLMSGSGPTVFGLFEGDDSINAAYEDLKNSGIAPELFITGLYDPKRN